MQDFSAGTPTRTIFMHMPAWQQVLFYVLVAVSLAYLAYQIVDRARKWSSGKPIDWPRQPIKNLVQYILFQRKVRSSRPRSGAPMHLMIFYGFLAMFVATSILAVAKYGWVIGIPNFHKGNYYLLYEALFETLGLLFVIGVTWAIVRRNGFRPKVISHNWKDNWALLLLWLVGVTGYLLTAARISNNPQPWDGFSWVSYGLAQLMPGVSNGGYVAIWWFHMVWVLVFFAVIPQMRIKHIVYAMFSAAHKPDWPMGELKPISMEEVEKTGLIGVTTPKEFSRWHLMSLDACMECGRCTEVCPAYGVGKVLNPKKVVQDIHGIMATDSNVAETVSDEALWACTTCNACVEACPVLIRHVDLIVDARRHLVAEGKLTGTPAVMLRQTQSTGHAWGAPSSSREDWMKGLNVPLAREKKEFDVLFWVGCAGATDPGAMRTTKAVAELMGKAGVDFACLGTEEKCTGDSARRVGDEFLFQEMAMNNIATFDKYKVKKIVTPCPHCLNTLKNEYGQFEGHYEVQHHSQFLRELVEQGKLNRVHPEQGEMTFHDPCYLGRVNNESDAPRYLLGDDTNLNSEAIDLVRWAESGVDDRVLVEPRHHGRKTLCCGAGGGRMFFDELPHERPANRRVAELLETGAKTIAIGCPFCRIMLDPAVKEQSGDSVRLADLAELLQEANRVPSD
ncbi:MAG TPA: heterodisulfide reductase-related iron-sulfur binding cluster [Fimbriimonadaceae bacterium]|nr:heterodisulfide reductase-related iron-sulfur binding cluster [Fimbriimonadaceae bacterium]HRJ34117.1 heterodisulfide reductase-related iron-sulfur binding cluster [Fimbriimonadaceae bacterium]